MKPTRYKKWAVLALALANGCFAAAQSNGVPGPTAYPAVSGFIAGRNIFGARFWHGFDDNRRETINVLCADGLGGPTAQRAGGNEG